MSAHHAAEANDQVACALALIESLPSCSTTGEINLEGSKSTVLASGAIDMVDRGENWRSGMY